MMKPEPPALIYFFCGGHGQQPLQWRTHVPGGFLFTCLGGRELLDQGSSCGSVIPLLQLLVALESKSLIFHLCYFSFLKYNSKFKDYGAL